MLWIVIIAGGRGERFWPRSLEGMPKQFLPVVSGQSMLQDTFDRCRPEFGADRIVVVAERKLKKPILAQLPRVEAGNLIVEPERRGTAPAIGLAAALLLKRDPDAVLAVVTADSVIEPKEEFVRAVRTGERLAEEGFIAVFGIKPDRPATEYGYIEVGKKMKGGYDLEVYGVRMFREKPKLEQALAFLEQGGFLWNSGMFAFRARTIVDAFGEHMPELHYGLTRILGAAGTAEEKKIAAELFSGQRSVSIDYGVMEKAKNIACVIPRFSWDDVGSWGSIARHRAKDRSGNVVEGNAVLVGSANNVVLGDGRSVLALVGVQDLIVVKEGERILVCHKTKDQAVKEALKALSEREELRKFL